MKFKIESKKGFTTQDFVIAGLLFSGVVAFFVLAILGISANYPDNPNIINENFSSSYNTLIEQVETIDTMRGTATAGEGLEFRGTFDVTFGSFFTIMQLVFATLNLFGNMWVNIVRDFTFLDSTTTIIFFTLGLSIITTILVFRLINAVGRNPV